MAKIKEDINIYESYLRDISKYGVIGGTKMKEYLKAYKTGSDRERKVAKERLVGSLQRFVLSIANKFSHGDNLMDIVAEGNVGLMKAIESYDINSEVKFTTYATYWVRKTIMRYITVEEPIVKPYNAIKIATYVPKIRKEFWNKNFRQPTTEEIQEIIYDRYRLNIMNKEELLSLQPSSIDEKYDSDEDGQEFMETNLYVSKTAKCDTDCLTKRSDKKIVVNEILSNMSERDAYIIKCIYGISHPQRTVNDVAEELGVTKERVRQIAFSGVSKLGKRFNKFIDSY
jgi:RNA polymerase primary sigma factor